MNKELNIIEAVNMPIGTEFEVFFKSGRKGTQKVIVSEELGSHKLIWEDGKDVKSYGCIINAKFIPVQKPVSFIDAVKSGKRIRVSSPEYELIDFCTIGNAIHKLSLMISEEYMRKVILNGKWYIEE